VAVDTREKYSWRFAGRQITVQRRALPCGDYGVVLNERVIAVVERKTLENLATSLSEGTLSFQMQRLAEVGRSAVVIEGGYPDLFRAQPSRGTWLADMLGRLAVRYPEVPIVFAGSRKFAEEWALSLAQTWDHLKAGLPKTCDALQAPETMKMGGGRR